MNSNIWLNKIDPEELKFMLPALFVLEDDPELAAKFLYREGHYQILNAAGDKEKMKDYLQKERESRPPKKYWDQVKDEVFSLVCSDSVKYSDLRKQLSTTYDNGTKALITIISASIGSTLGLEAGIISGFVTLALHMVIKIGVEAYCAVKNPNL